MRTGAVLRFPGHQPRRARRWPVTANPHVFIHARAALGTDLLGQRWIKLKTGLTARVMREDPILDEVHASGGDLRRLMDLFGLTAQGAQRFTATLGHPLLTLEPGTVPAED